MAGRPWWDEQVYEDRRPALLTRNRIKASFAARFLDWDFVEVDPCCLQISPGNETHLHAFATELVGTDLTRTPLYLHTSPEFACKKLLAAGEERLFTFAHVFRNRERGPLHHPEFTMLEWYRARAVVADLMRDLGELLALAAEIGGLDRWTWAGRACDPRAEPEVITVDNAFTQFVGIDLRATYGPGGQDREALASAARLRGVSVAPDDSWSDLFSKLLTTFIEPKLGIDRPQFLTRYPVCEAALARVCSDDPSVAERFELYVAGVELANGFDELTDAEEQRRRFEAQMAARAAIYGDRYPVDGELLAALAQMPRAAGIALGFDRLAMLAVGAQRIDQVIWTPVAEPVRGGRA
jgi:lysyl-tRNA synthetase class 2